MENNSSNRQNLPTLLSSPFSITKSTVYAHVICWCDFFKLQEPISSSPPHTSSTSLVQVGMIASYLLRPSPSTLHPLRSSHPIEAFALGLMKAVFALCRGIYIRGRESAKEVCQSPSVRPGITTVAAHPLLMLPASLEIIHLLRSLLPL